MLWLLAGASMLVVLTPASPTRAQVVQPPCQDHGPMFPGECFTIAYRITNPNAIDATFFTRIRQDSVVVYDEDVNPVGGADRAAFLAELTVVWERHAWLTAPDPGDANRSSTHRTGGIDVLVQPQRSEYCGRAPFTQERTCRLGRIHRAGSASLALQRTDERLAYLTLYLAADADPRFSGWQLTWNTVISAAVPAQSDCPGAEVNSVCTVPVYER